MSGLGSKAIRTAPRLALMPIAVSALNQDFALPDAPESRIEQCGKANARCDPGNTSITVCSDDVAYLTDLIGE